MPISATAEHALAVRDLEVAYGKSRILRGVSFEVLSGEVVAILGANGVGKTTLLNSISGFARPARGRILLHGEDITRLQPHEIHARGIIQVSQTRDLFPDLTVEDNLRLGGVRHNGKAGVDSRLEAVFRSFPRLLERRNQPTRTLSGGEQQMVAIGRAVMGRPRILLLDEPSGGLAPQFIDEIAAIVASLKAGLSTMLLIEQNIALAFRVAARFLILRDGRITGGGPMSAISSRYDDVIRSIYL
ncbi:MAG TPA: ABC transporter ATP-binding protein [Xanthobacteraceae bacterium]|jgi:branched-chain amino acid transport system ATP-binding protein